MRAVPRCQRTSVAQHRFVVTNFAVCFIVFFQLTQLLYPLSGRKKARYIDGRRITGKW